MAETNKIFAAIKQTLYRKRSAVADEPTSKLSMDARFKKDREKLLSEASDKHIEEITRHLRKKYMSEQGKDATPSELRSIKRQALTLYLSLIHTLSVRLERQRSRNVVK